MHQLHLELCDGHLIVSDDGQVLLLDTGAPASVARGGKFRFLGREWPAQRTYRGVTTDELSRQVGRKIDVLLGADVLGQFTVRIDTHERRVVVNAAKSEMASALPLETVMEVPVLEAAVGGERVRMFFDTGAPLSYLGSGLARNYPLVRKARDFYPGFGEFETDVHAVPVLLGDQAVTLECGVLPPLLETTLPFPRAGGILGTELFNTFVAEWSVGLGELWLRGHAA